MAKIYRAALLGCGSRGGHASRAYRHHPRTDVVGLCDLDRERLDTLGDELGVDARFEDIKEMLAAVEPDIVIVPVQTDLHFPLAMRVLAARSCHLDMEKPMTVDLAQADALLARAGELGTRIAVHHQGSSLRSLNAVKHALEAGRIGVPLHITSNGKGYYGGYELMNMGTHMLSALLSVTGPCRRVTATLLTNGRPITAEDVVQSPSGMGTIAGQQITATLEFDEMLTGTLHQHMFPSIEREALGFEIAGTEGRLRWHYDGGWILPVPWTVPGRAEWEALPERQPPVRLPDGVSEGEYWYVDDYVNALDVGGSPPSDGRRGRHIIEIILAIFESGAYRRPVTLPQSERDHPLLRMRHEAGLGDPDPAPRPYREWLAVQAARHGWPVERTGALP